jgi:hypothetical protein
LRRRYPLNYSQLGLPVFSTNFNNAYSFAAYPQGVLHPNGVPAAAAAPLKNVVINIDQ